MAYRKGPTERAILIGLLVLIALNALFVLLDKVSFSIGYTLQGVVIPKWSGVIGILIGGELNFGDIGLLLPALIIPVVAGIFLGMIARGAPSRSFKIGFGLGFFYYYVIVILLLLMSNLSVSLGEGVDAVIIPSDFKEIVIFLFTIPLPIAILIGIGATISAFVLSKYASVAHKSGLERLTSLFSKRKGEAEIGESSETQEETEEGESDLPEEGDEETTEISEEINEEPKPSPPEGTLVFPLKEIEEKPPEEEKTKSETPEPQIEKPSMEEPTDRSEEKPPGILDRKLADISSKSETEESYTKHEQEESQSEEDKESVSPTLDELRNSLKTEPKEAISEDNVLIKKEE